MTTRRAGRRRSQASIEYGRYFENLFKNIGVVRMGFPEQIDYAQDRQPR